MNGDEQLLRCRAYVTVHNLLPATMRAAAGLLPTTTLSTTGR
ncbi:hypothetical protein [Streptomyces sp. NPDC059122]